MSEIATTAQFSQKYIFQLMVSNGNQYWNLFGGTSLLLLSLLLFGEFSDLTTSATKLSTNYLLEYSENQVFMAQRTRNSAMFK